MAIDALAAARRICERSGWSITNLKLQKILYMAHMAYMGEHNGQPLIKGHFEAWDYGPVEPLVYRRACSFGRHPVQDVFPSMEADGEYSSEFSALDAYTDALLKFSAPQLVSMTHWNKGAWAKHYCAGEMGIQIPNEDIQEEYRERLQGK